MDFDTIQKATKQALADVFALTEEQANEAIINVAETDIGIFEKEFAAKMGTPTWEQDLSIEGLALSGHDFSVEITQESNDYTVFVNFGTTCLDVDSANSAMAEYDVSKWSALLPVENAVESEQDGLLLIYNFTAETSDEIYQGLKVIFEAFQNKECAELLCNMAQYFK